jgi:hypothetical protein
MGNLERIAACRANGEPLTRFEADATQAPAAHLEQRVDDGGRAGHRSRYFFCVTVSLRRRKLYSVMKISSGRKMSNECGDIRYDSIK